MRSKTTVSTGRHNNHCVAASNLTLDVGWRTLSTTLLGFIFVSTSVAVNAKTLDEDKTSSSGTAVVDRSNSVTRQAIRWWARTGTNAIIGVLKGGKYAWESAPRQEDLIPYATGLGAGVISFVGQRMVVQRAAGAAMDHPGAVAAAVAGGMALQYAATNTETGTALVDSVTNALPEIPEAAKEGYAVGASAAGAVALAVDMYEFAGAIKQRYETPKTDPDVEKKVDKQYKKAKSKLEHVEEDLQKAKSDIESAKRTRQSVIDQRGSAVSQKKAAQYLKQAEKALPLAERRFIDVKANFDTVQANRQHLAQIKVDREVAAHDGVSAGAAMVFSDIRGVTQTEAGTKGLKSAAVSALSFVKYVTLDAPFDTWSGLPGGGEPVPGGNKAPEEIIGPQNTLNKTPVVAPSNGTKASEQVVDRKVNDKKVNDHQDDDHQDDDHQDDDHQDDDHQEVEDHQDGDHQVGDQQDGDHQVGDQQDDDHQVGDQQDDDQEVDDRQDDDHQVEDQEDEDQQDEDLEGDDAPPAGKSAVRPAAGSYNSNAWAANTMFQMSLSDRLASYYPDGDSAHSGSAWIRYSGSRIRLKDNSGELATKGDKNAVMMGLDMLLHSTNSRNQFTAGVMGGYGHFAGRTRSGSFNDSSLGKVDGHAIGMYGTYQQDTHARHGLYADSWLLWNEFDNTVKDGDRPTEKYDAKGVTASLEVGYHMQLAEHNNVRYVLQPHTQIIYQNVRADNFREADGTQVTFLNGSRAQTVVGVRAAAQIPTGLTSVITPYLDVSWQHSTKGYGVRLGDVGANMDSGRDVGQLKLGVQGEITRAVSLNVGLFHNQGNAGYRETGGNVMATYRY